MENTQHLDLKQWQLEDFILMEDFNADNQKVDAAFGQLQQTQQQMAEDFDALQQGLALVKLGSAVGNGSDRLSLDLSGVDLSDYSRLQLYLTCHNMDAGLRLFFDTNFTSGGGLALGSAKAGGYACQLQLVPLTGGFWHEYNSGNSEGAKSSGAAYTALTTPAAVDHIYLAGYNNGKWLTFDSSCRVAIYGWRW